MREITYQQLAQANACSDQLRLFRKMFGDSVVPTEALARKEGHLFDADFAARNFLSAPLWEEYEKARDALWDKYYKARDSLWEEYNKARYSLWEKYAKARDSLWEQYYKACDSLWEQYEKARAPLLEQYKKACDSLWEHCKTQCMVEFVKLYQSEEN